MRGSVVYALLVLVAASMSAPALACTLHVADVGSIFERTYPGSLSVAMAVGKARSENRLPGASLDSGEAGLLRASVALRKLGRRLDRTTAMPKDGFFLMFAGQQMWTNYRTNVLTGRAAYSVDVHSAEPLHDVPIVLTSYYVVVALQKGQLTFSEALDSGMVQVRNDRQGKITSIFRQAFDAPGQSG